MARRRFDPSKALGGLFDGVDAGTPARPASPPTNRHETDASPPKPAPATPAAPDERPAPFTPSTLNGAIKNALGRAFPGSIEVTGELSNVRQGRHWYFTLKDDDAEVSCVMFGSHAARADASLANGDAVILRGRVDHWPAGGRTQLYVSSIRRRGLGSLEERFRRLCNELRDLGWFDEERKRPLPFLPRRVAVVTSKEGAAIHDVLETARRRLPFVEFIVIDVRVQGEHAAAEIARAIDLCDRHADTLGIEALLVTRGGGSREDLWAFNERVVAEAAHRCRVPLIAAIGHEVDTTVIELVADVRASTPTQAAMRLVPDGEELRRQCDHERSRLGRALDRRMERATDLIGAQVRRHGWRERGARFDAERNRLDETRRALARGFAMRIADEKNALAGRATELERRRPAERLAIATARVDRGRRALRDALHHRVGAAENETNARGRTLPETIERRVERAGEQLDAQARHLRSIGPSAVLARGYSLTTDVDGRIVRSSVEVPVGAIVRTTLGSGALNARVESVEPDREPSRDASSDPTR